MVILVIAIIDERHNLLLEITRQIIIFQHYPVLHGLVPPLGLFLSFRMMRGATNVIHISFIQPFG